MIISRLVAAVLTATSLLLSTAYAGRARREGQTLLASVAVTRRGGWRHGATPPGTVTHWGTVAQRLYPRALAIEGFPNDLSLDIEAVVLRQLDKDPRRRYATAAAFGTRTLRVTVLPLSL